LVKFFHLLEACAAVEAGVASAGIWDSSGRNSVGVDVSLSKATDLGIVYKYWGIDGFCVVGDVRVSFYRVSLLAISRFVGKADVGAEDVDVYRDVLVGVHVDRTV